MTAESRGNAAMRSTAGEEAGENATVALTYYIYCEALILPLIASYEATSAT